MLLTLVTALDTTDLLTVVKHLSMSPLDIDLLLYEAQEDGKIEIDKKKGKIKILKELGSVYYDTELAEKLVKIIKQYDKQKANITRNRLEEITLDLAGKENPQGSHGYPIHDFICTMYALEQGVIPGYEAVNKYTINIPAIKKKRPANIFVFYTFEHHQEFGAKAANDFIDMWHKANVK